MTVQEVLDGLTQERGVLGALVVTEDGVVAAQSGVTAEEGDRMGAVATEFLRQCRRHLRTVGLYDTRVFVLEAEHGRLMVQDLEAALLVVLLERRLRLEGHLFALAGAARRLRRLRRLAARIGT